MISTLTWSLDLFLGICNSILILLIVPPVCSQSCVLCLNHWYCHPLCCTGQKPLINDLSNSGHRQTSSALILKYVQNPVLPNHLFWYHPRPSYFHLLLGVLAYPLFSLLLSLAGVVLLICSRHSSTQSPLQWVPYSTHSESLITAVFYRD